jgi:hypothetical protein
MLIGLEIWEELEWNERNPDSDEPIILRKLQPAMQSTESKLSLDSDHPVIYAAPGKDEVTLFATNHGSRRK